ncbi:unnamed protein product [Prorocentrum cordatum]|uniref:Uncharacterized protein n=1 Tax=Prorocentrum cordatum TaxID=2364126 RepID=A0ABN9UKY2_9DINO|nr:unnamed protein product [Polarella glacialis]
MSCRSLRARRRLWPPHLAGVGGPAPIEESRMDVQKSIYLCRCFLRNLAPVKEPTDEWRLCTMRGAYWLEVSVSSSSVSSCSWDDRAEDLGPRELPPKCREKIAEMALSLGCSPKPRYPSRPAFGGLHELPAHLLVGETG